MMTIPGGGRERPEQRYAAICDYTSFEPAVRGHDFAHWSTTAGWRGEARDGRSLSGSVLRDFGRNSGDRVEYRFTAPACSERGVSPCALQAGGGCRSPPEGIGYPAGARSNSTRAGDYALVRFDCTLEQGVNRLTLESLTAEPVTVDTAVLRRWAAVAAVTVSPGRWSINPHLPRRITACWSRSTATCKTTMPNRLGLSDDWRSRVRQQRPRCLHAPRYAPPSAPVLHGRPKRLLYLGLYASDRAGPKSDTTIYSLLATGSRQQAEAALRRGSAAGAGPLPKRSPDVPAGTLFRCCPKPPTTLSANSCWKRRCHKCRPPGPRSRGISVISHRARTGTASTHGTWDLSRWPSMRST